ncbi:hypothetical protein DVA86_20485 [Streptomyces armeniacus]|uniref:Uncharacterized protein n=1 Tax=Streptomyces armeniacus TaxID=83291 RepID=A0A345XSQ6_9ACTN|nr:hypothetical protein [Streptomyces armeniacus]AXK34672.1 hypothetical protein DVA86_20485 [Streptomyces armeniacus]
MTILDRLAEIEARVRALPECDWRQREDDTGVIEDTDGQPVLVLGTSGDTRLPAGEFLAHAPDDVRWLIQELTQARAQLAELDATRDRIRTWMAARDTEEAASDTAHRRP